MCTFNPMNTLPPVDMHTSHRDQKPHHTTLGLLQVSPQQGKTCAWEEGLFTLNRDRTRVDKSRCRQYRNPDSSPMAVFIP